MRRYFRGMGYLTAGFRFVLHHHPSLFKYCLLPLLISGLVLLAVATGLFYHYRTLVNLLWAKPTFWLLEVLWYVFYIFGLLAVVLVALGVSLVLQAVLAAPFNDLLSERAEMQSLGRPPPPFSWARASRTLGRTLAHELARLLIYLGLMAPLFIATLLIPILGHAVFAVAGFCVSAMYSGYDCLDPCMSRREWSFARKWRVLREQRALTLGLGSGLTFGLLVPILGIFCLPMAVVGGTLLFCDLERAGAFDAEHDVLPRT